MKNFSLFNKLLLHYQPIIDPSTFRTFGFEALCRLDEGNNRPLVYPGSFLPMLSDADLARLDASVIFKCMQNHKFFSDSELIFINLQGIFSLPQSKLLGFIELLTNKLNTLGIKPSSIVFEVCEQVDFFERPDIAHSLHCISQLGFRIAIDDYGTHHSNLYRLCTIPCNFLKIDRSIINLLSNQYAKRKVLSFLKIISAYSTDHDISIICEGVETLEQHRILLDIESDILLQGFLYSKPLPIKDIRNKVTQEFQFKAAC